MGGGTEGVVLLGRTERVRAEVDVAKNSHGPLALRVEQRGVIGWTEQSVGAVVSSTLGSTALIKSP